MPVNEHKHVPLDGARWRCWVRGIEHCTVPDQLVVDKKLEFRVKVGKTNTEGGPVVGREHREEVVDRRTVSTTHNTQSQESHKHGGGGIKHIKGK